MEKERHQIKKEMHKASEKQPNPPNSHNNQT